MRVIDTRYDKRLHSAGTPKCPNKAANKSSRSRAKTDAYMNYLSVRIAVSMQAERDMRKDNIQPVFDSRKVKADRELNRQLKKIYGKAWRDVKAAHPKYQL